MDADLHRCIADALEQAIRARDKLESHNVGRAKALLDMAIVELAKELDSAARAPTRAPSQVP